MKNFKISITFDSLFIFVSAFFLFYAIIRYSGVNFIPSLTLSILISLALGVVWTVFSLIKKDKQGIKLAEENNLLSLKTELCFMSDKSLTDTLLKYYKKANIQAEKENDYIVLPELKCQVFSSFAFEKTDTTKIIEFYKQTKKGYKTVVLSIDYTVDAVSLVNDLSLRIKLFDLNAVYLSLKEYNLLPKTTLTKKVNKISFVDKMKGIFIKSNGKKALTLGIIILLSSKFSFYPVYYIIFGGLLIIFSLILRFWGKSPLSPSKAEKVGLC